MSIKLIKMVSGKRLMPQDHTSRKLKRNYWTLIESPI